MRPPTQIQQRTARSGLSEKMHLTLNTFWPQGFGWSIGVGVSCDILLKIRVDGLEELLHVEQLEDRTGGEISGLYNKINE